MDTPDLLSPSLQAWLPLLKQSHPDSRKGNNGKALVIGGSDLFHAASQWSFTAASRLVDMLFYSSVKENNQLIQQSKILMTDGVVVPRRELPNYLSEVQAALIGPGMRRDTVSRFSAQQLNELTFSDLTEHDWETDTKAVTSVLLRTFPTIRWVIDAGALQVLERAWLPPGALLTPHAGEFEQLVQRWSPEFDLQSTRHLKDQFPPTPNTPSQVISLDPHPACTTLAQQWGNATVLLKGPVDLVFNAEELVAVTGGNAGLTKGGTGDVLAGLTLGLAATSPAFESAVVATALIKQAATDLAQSRGEMYNSSDLAEQLPHTFARHRPPNRKDPA